MPDTTLANMKVALHKIPQATRRVLVLAGLLSLAGCGGSISLAFFDDDLPVFDTAPFVTISQPSSAALFSTSASQLAIGGSVANASLVRVQNTTTGETVDIHVPRQNLSVGWVTPALNLVPGDNLIVATADADGTGRQTSADTLTVRRPL
jgi:hypothetical protein